MRITMLAAAAALLCSIATPASAQQPATGIVSIYHVAPGHQVMFLKWLAEQERIAAAAGIGSGQLYVHTDGDSWDYLVISPQTTSAQDDALDAAAKRLGLTYGPRVSIELRKHINSHTDTFVVGPTSAVGVLSVLGEK